ncbi:hypothetical protein [Fulvivirga sedimenti]|uniref:Uncharacterized protein n=1 Tax=Fulvivirga sedimenti TaxID=2879465 RepID=A0A9X1HNH6_9BACT|nr:hypothetical protein [Fulvivirga sedimenti]MCA6074260.1 hypothetical protein [Fulvivirga sedimenti]
MKINRLLIPAIIALFILSGCDHRAELISVVHEDGSIDKSIILTEVDSSHINENYFGISPKTGWAVEVKRVESLDDDENEEPLQDLRDSVQTEKKTDMQIIFTKSFPSVESMNAELNQPVDTLFQVEAKFEKRFRWFYTYLDYSETYRAADRFRVVKQADFFTKEEYEFIQRLPARGKKVSAADSLYAEALNKKIFDEYSMEGIIEEHFQFMRESIVKYNLGDDAVKKLEDSRPGIVEILTESDDEQGDDLVPTDDDLYLLELVDSLVVPLPRPQMDADYIKFNDEFEKRLNFMSWVSDGTFTQRIEMPWELVENNADSVDGNRLTWEPPLMRFLLTDYTMQATSRKMNLWAVIVSGLIVILTLILYVRSGKKTNG